MTLFSELSQAFLLAGIVAAVFAIFRLHSILAYIIAGFLLGPSVFGALTGGPIFTELSQIGVTMLLFMVGLEMDLDQLKSLGKRAGIAGILQVLVTTAVGFFILKAFGMESLSSLIVSVSLAFSSTVLVVKLLTEKRELQSLHGKLSVSVFLIQDIVAIALLVILGAHSDGSVQDVVMTIAGSLVKGLLLIGALYAAGKSVLPALLKKLGHSDELIMIFSLAWVFGIAALCESHFIGLNLEVGGFIAGITLASSSYHFQISARMKSLRDFFLIIFFLVLGMNLRLSADTSALIPAVILVVFVLIGNPIILTAVYAALGFKPRTAFLAGITVNQVSEFSLVLIAVAASQGYVSGEATALVTLVAATTLAISPYGILQSQNIYTRIKPWLKYLEFKRTKSSAKKRRNFSDHIVLIGAHRLGEKILTHLKLGSDQVVVIDFNPDVVTYMKSLGYEAFYGDATDPEIQEVAHMKTAKVIVSTIPVLRDNLSLLASVKEAKLKAKVILAAHTESDSHKLYQKGADYVLLPHHLGALYVSRLLNSKKFI